MPPALVILACLVICVTGSHFRGGIISLRPIHAENKTMEITLRTSYRRDFDQAGLCNQQTVDDQKEVGSYPPYQGIFCVSGCKNNPLVSLIKYVCTDFSLTDNWEYGERSVRYTFYNVTTVKLSAQGCCWVSPLDGSWDLFTFIDLTVRADTGRINSSPQARFFPVIRIQEGCNSSIAIRPYDPDDDVVRCRWGIGKECSGICNGFIGAILNEETCTLTYDGRTAGVKGIALMMEDFSKTDTDFVKPLSTVALNLLVNVSSSHLNCTLPEFVKPTPADGSCIAIPPNTTYSTQVVVDTKDSTVGVTEIKTVSPVGVSKSALTAIPASTLTAVNISWTPQPSDYYYYENNNNIETICLTGVFSSEQSTAERCIQWMAGVDPPRVIPNSVYPKNIQINPENPTFVFHFDQYIRKSARSGRLVIREIETHVDVFNISSSTEHIGESIVVENNVELHQVVVSTEFRLAEKTNYSVLLEAGFVEGTIGCGPESEPFPPSDIIWMFETRDLTPPDITFTQASTRSNGTITITWISNEALSSISCKISTGKGVELTQYQCFGDSWTSSQLEEGTYAITVKAIDLAGNSASRVHQWKVDRTPPLVQISAPFPGHSSNRKSIIFRISCPHETACSYTCVIINANNDATQVQCFNDQVSIPILTQEGKYNFIVSAVDDVGNVGLNYTYTWTADFTAPNINDINNVSVSCDSTLSPDTVPKPTVTDNSDNNPRLTYLDNGQRGDCKIVRQWEARDSAGNVATAEQIITLTLNLTINFLPQLRRSCDPAENVTAPVDTANVDNICQRSVTLKMNDSDSSPACPSQLVRTWTATDSCGTSKSPVVKTQIISFYSICPPSACGRNYQPPHGTCIEGRCICYKPYTGEECDIIVNPPIIKEVPDNITLKENQEFQFTVELLQGTDPVYCKLEMSPKSMRINQVTCLISWQAEDVGEIPIRVQAVNRAGTDRFNFTITVTPGYTVTLNPLIQVTYPTAKSIKLSGTIEYQPGNLVESKYNGTVPIDIYVMVSGTSRKFQTYSNQDKTFLIEFEPLRLEYGKYKAIGSHPGLPSGISNVEWDILGMKLIKPIITIEDQFVLGKVEKIYVNYTQLVNDGPAALKDVKVTYMQNIPDGVTIDVMFGQDKTISILNPGDSVPINIQMSFSSPFGSVRVFFRIRSSEGVFVNLILNAVISLAKPAVASFGVQPRTLSESVPRGTQRLVQFNIANTGPVAASGVSVSVPNVKYLSVVSFGNSSYASEKQDIQVGQSLVLVLRLSANQESKLGRYTGKIGINALEIQDSFNIDLKIISDKKASVTFRVEDEFTYFAEGSPLVENAKIIIYGNGNTLTKTTELEKGLVTFSGLLDGTYEVSAEASRHGGKKGVYVFKPGSSTIRIFLQRTAVTYRWTVTPTQVKDVYKVQVEADFETQVPMPVVTVNPTSIDLEQFELGFINYFELNFTNHGLIKADAFKFEFPKNHPGLEFTPLATFDQLDAQTSKIVPVKVLQKSNGRRKRASCGSFSADANYGYDCGGWIPKDVAVALLSPFRSGCGSSSGGGGSWRGGGGLGGGGYITYRSRTPSSGKGACKPCLQAYMNCLLSFTPLGPLPCLLRGAKLATDQAKPSDFTQFGVCAAKMVVGTVFKPLALPINLYDCVEGISKACDSTGGTSSSSRRKRDVKNQVIKLMAKAARPVAAMVEWKLEVYGKQVWLTVDDEVWFTESFIQAISDDSELGEAITRQEYDSIMNKAQPEGITKKDVSDFLTRWNGTVYDWTNGRLEPTEAEPNRMSYSRVQKLKSEISKGQEEAVSAGFESFIDVYNDQVEAMKKIDNLDEDEGVCAVVRVRIEQELTLTREGFNAKLEIDNGEISTLTDIDVKISIRDAETGEYSTNLFSLGNATSGGDITSARSLSMQKSGELTWLIIPYSEAAPNNEKYYDVGGILYYKVDGVLVSVPLLPARITVQPDPSLFVHYFWEKFVISDDPFTEKVEPAVPFNLAVVVTNAGKGTAKNLRITSSQPEIIENEKGLLVTFKMIGANIGNQNVTASLSVVFGDIIPDTTVVASWLMVSSLKGKFQNYSATFENENPLGDPRLSLIDDLQVHELIQRVSLVKGDTDDQISDFLVNDIIDIDIFPDAVYSSASLAKHNVSMQNISLTQKIHLGTGNQFVLSATPSKSGYVYYRFQTDVQLPDLISVSSQSFQRIMTTNTEELPSENAWFTTMIGEKESEVLIGHIFDYISDPGFVHQYEVTYSNVDLSESTVVLRPTQAPIEVDLKPNGCPSQGAT